VLPTVDEVRARIEDLLDAGPCELVQDAERPVRRLGLALGPPAEPVPDDLDALLLHRSWGFEPAPGLGVLGCHDPFDHRLGLAHNPWLHERLGLTDPAPLAAKATLHTAPPDLDARVTRLFGGREGVRPGAAGALAAAGVDRDGAPKAVLADALRPELVHAAAGAGARLYVTGTFRVPAAAAIDATGMTVLLVGHARQERWSLRLLGELLAERLPTTTTVMLDNRTR